MTGLETLQEAMEATTAAAADFRVAESQVEGFAERIPRLGPGRQGAHLAGLLHSGLLGVAAQHHAECDREVCGTCDAIRHALTTSLASLRVMIDDYKINAVPRLRRPWLSRRSGR